MQAIVIVIAIIIGLGAAFMIGKYGAKFSNKLYDRRLKKGMIDVLEGKRENKIEINGKILDVDRFILKDRDEKEILVSFKDGLVATEKVPETEPPEPIVQDEELKKPAPKKTSTKKKTKKKDTKKKDGKRKK